MFIGSAILYGQADMKKLNGTFLQLFGVNMLQNCKIYYYMDHITRASYSLGTSGKIITFQNLISVYFNDNFICNHSIIFQHIPYILESNPHSVFGDFLNGKKLVCVSNLHLSFNRPLPTEQLIE
jgi:hypothetical protein